MPRINDYVQLAAQTAREIAADGETWHSFLQTASTLYKYGFYDQMMIYAQRPDATACASFELWTNTMRRYVRRGAKGIALLDMTGDVPRYRYVFDISDTGTRQNARTPFTWTIREENRAPIAAMLEKEYEVSANRGLAGQLEEIAISGSSTRCSPTTPEAKSTPVYRMFSVSGGKDRRTSSPSFCFATFQRRPAKHLP